MTSATKRHPCLLFTLLLVAFAYANWLLVGCVWFLQIEIF